MKSFLPFWVLTGLLVALGGACSRPITVQPNPIALYTATPTSTATFTTTSSVTASATSTSTATPTATQTLSHTITATLVATSTGTSTATRTATAANTATDTPTVTSTDTPMNTATVTPTSTDTPAWIESTASAAFSGRFWHSSVVYNNLMWVMAGTSSYPVGQNDVWSSADGNTWNSATGAAAFQPRSGAAAVVFDDGGGSAMWLLTGLNSAANGAYADAWKSTDGSTWTAATTTAAFGPKAGAAAVVFGSPSSIFVIAGQNPAYQNDVWGSADGINWTQTAAAAFNTARISPAAVAFNGKMWVIGGFDNATPPAGYVNDVYSSTDGITWNLELANGPTSTHFSPRSWHTCVVHNGAMWVIAGFDGSTDLNDVWSSTDGVTWTQESQGLFSQRDSHTSLDFNGSVWVIGGFDGSYLNDVWHTP